MTSTIQIAWLAGLLEGEGCFYMDRKNPVISLCMTDLDTVVRASRIMKIDTLVKRKVMSKYSHNSKHKDQYLFKVCTFQAVQWMMTLYPLLGLRRKAKIKEILTTWKATKYNGNHKIYVVPQRVAI